VTERSFLPAKGARKLFAKLFTRTATLWLVLIAMFVVIWVLLEPSSGSAPPTRAPVDTNSGGNLWTTILPVLVGVIVFAVLGPLVRTFNASNAAGLKFLGDGDYALAGRTFETLATRYRWVPIPIYRTLASYNLAALDALKPVAKGEFALLESGWPEMRAFLIRLVA